MSKIFEDLDGVNLSDKQTQEDLLAEIREFIEVSNFSHAI
jgi:hypothetical protein